MTDFETRAKGVHVAGGVVAIVPVRDRVELLGPTLRSLREIAELDEIVVIDDESPDGGAVTAAADAAGATVLRLSPNRGKGAAVTRAIAARPTAGVYLLADADLGGSAALAAGLLPPVLSREADMTIAVAMGPGAGPSGGFGLVRRLAGWSIRRTTGFSPRAPLSGQRAVAGELLRSLVPLAPGFGLETALTIDACRAGARIQEVPLAISHRAAGRGLAGFWHRAGQGVDILRAVWPRLSPRRARAGHVSAAGGTTTTR